MQSTVMTSDNKSQAFSEAKATDTPQIIGVHGYANNKRTSRLGMLILLIALGVFLLWAAIAPLDEGVPTEGVVNVEGSHKIIQHFTGGIVSSLLVREGQEVKSGDVLIKLDDTSIQSRADDIRQHYLGLRAAYLLEKDRK